MLDLAANEVWFVTGSQHLYGPEVLDTVAEHSRTIAAALDEAPSIPVKVVFDYAGVRLIPGMAATVTIYTRETP